MARTPLQIIVGLGNPGPEHRLTRHNAGFWFVDALARAHGAQFRAHARYQGEICAQIVARGARTRAAEAADLHESQRPLGPRADRLHQGAGRPSCWSCTTSSTCAVGVARLKLGGGHGGHNGLRDTSRTAARTSGGCGSASAIPATRSQVIDYVLQRASAADEEAIVARASGRPRCADDLPARRCGEGDARCTPLRRRSDGNRPCAGRSRNRPATAEGRS